MPFTKDGISPNIIVNPNALKNMKQKGAFVNLLLVRNILNIYYERDNQIAGKSTKHNYHYFN